MTQGQNIRLETEIPPELSGKRVDLALATLYPQYSRAQFQQWIKDGKLNLCQQPCTKPRTMVNAGDLILIETVLAASTDWQAQQLDIKVEHEDDSLMVINKVAGMVVHPGAGNYDNTLANALLHNYPALHQLPRAGVIHRLDKETSGLLLIAKTPQAYQALVAMMKARAIKREYLALVKGLVISGATIDAPIGRHKTQRTKMALVATGREAITHYRVTEKFAAHTLLRVTLETGRTHQIRVHMESINHPLVGDQQYRKAVALPAKLSQEQQQALQTFRRQALHAEKLTLKHPQSGELMTFQAEIPEDLRSLLAILRKNS